MKLLEIYSAEHTDMKVKCQKSYFMEKILPRADDEIYYDYEAIKRWMRERVEEFDIILYPINIVQQHWALAVVYTNAKRIQYYDSDGGNGDLYLRTLRMYVHDHGDRNEWELVSDAHLGPQQTNGFDCGVFVCISAFWIINGKTPSYNQRYIRHNGRSSIRQSIETEKLVAVEF